MTHSNQYLLEANRHTERVELKIVTSEPIINECGELVYLAGMFVEAGTYSLVDSNRLVYLEQDDVLPPSFDGHRAEYILMERPWLTGLAS